MFQIIQVLFYSYAFRTKVPEHRGAYAPVIHQPYLSIFKISAAITEIYAFSV